jgi:hypothetical protein
MAAVSLRTAQVRVVMVVTAVVAVMVVVLVVLMVLMVLHGLSFCEGDRLAWCDDVSIDMSLR